MNVATPLRHPRAGACEEITAPTFARHPGRREPWRATIRDPGEKRRRLLVFCAFGESNAGSRLAFELRSHMAGMTVFQFLHTLVGGTRPPIILEADGRWYVGPGNGLFELVLRRAEETRRWDIDWKPERLSASFHGRDLFAPVAALLARSEPPPRRPREDGADRRADWPDDLREIVYIDHFGNAMTGLRSAMLQRNARLAVAGRVVESARTFSDRPPGAAFWYENANGLVEIAVNQGRADRELGLAIGVPVESPFE
jgi:S-adenosylmethionine hydrolase